MVSYKVLFQYPLHAELEMKFGLFVTYLEVFFLH